MFVLGISLATQHLDSETTLGSTICTESSDLAATYGDGLRIPIFTGMPPDIGLSLRLCAALCIRLAFRCFCRPLLHALPHHHG